MFNPFKKNRRFWHGNLDGEILYQGMPVRPYYPKGAIRIPGWKMALYPLFYSFEDWFLQIETPCYVAGGGFNMDYVYCHFVARLDELTPAHYFNYGVSKYKMDNVFLFHNYFHALAWALKCKKLQIVGSYLFRRIEEENGMVTDYKMPIR